MIGYFVGAVLVTTSVIGADTGWGKEFQVDMDYPKTMGKVKGQTEEDWSLDGGSELAKESPLKHPNDTEPGYSSKPVAGCDSMDPSLQRPTSKKPLVLTFQIIINNNSTLALAQEKNKTTKPPCKDDVWRKMNVEALKKIFDKCQDNKNPPLSTTDCVVLSRQRVDEGEEREEAKEEGGSPLLSYLKSLKTRLSSSHHGQAEDWARSPRIDPGEVIYLVKRSPSPEDLFYHTFPSSDP